jgi:hypothetical protein
MIGVKGAQSAAKRTLDASHDSINDEKWLCTRHFAGSAMTTNAILPCGDAGSFSGKYLLFYAATNNTLHSLLKMLENMQRLDLEYGAGEAGGAGSADDNER